MEPGRRGQDRQPPSQRSRGAALPGLDRQPPPHRTTHRPDGADLSSRSRAAPRSSSVDEPPPDSEALTTQSGGPNGHREVRNVSPKASCAEQIPLGYPWSTAAGASYMDNPKAPKGG